MESQLETTSTPRSSIVLSHREVLLTQIIYHVNQVKPYQLSAIQIEDWARSVNELYPTLDLAVLKGIIREMKLGKIEWDNQMGIQNIFIALSDKGFRDAETENKMRINESEYARP